MLYWSTKIVSQILIGWSAFLADSRWSDDLLFPRYIWLPLVRSSSYIDRPITFWPRTIGDDYYSSVVSIWHRQCESDVLFLEQKYILQFWATWCVTLETMNVGSINYIILHSSAWKPRFYWIALHLGRIYSCATRNKSIIWWFRGFSSGIWNFYRVPPSSTTKVKTKNNSLLKLLYLISRNSSFSSLPHFWTFKFPLLNP